MIRGDEILKRLATATPRVAEVGVQEGKLSRYLLKRRPDLILCMVDNWLSWRQQPEAYRATRDGSAFLEVEQCAERYRRACVVAKFFAPRAIIAVGNSVDVARECGARFDLVFIDADHSYDGVKDDLAAWFPLVRAGGWIGGHDYGNPSTRYDFSGVRRAVDERFGAAVVTGGDFTWWVKK